MRKNRAVRASILLLAYNKRIYTEICLLSLLRTVPEDVEILVLNNGSSDDTSKFLKRIRDPRVRPVSLRKNIGVSRGYNLLRTRISPTSPLLVFLNNDIVLQDGWFSAMAREMNRADDVGVVGARLLYPQTGCVQHAGILFRAVEPRKTFDMFHPGMNEPAEANGRHRALDVPAVTGALMMTRTKLFDRTRGWDTRFWLGGEDTDFCLKVLDMGHRVRYVPDATAFHFGSVTVADDRSGESENLKLLNRRWAAKVFGKWSRFVVDPYRPLKDHLKRGRKRMVIFGTGARAEQFRPMLEKMGFHLVGWSDNNPSWHHQTLNGLAVLPPKDVPSLKPDIVVVASMFKQDIIRNLGLLWENRIPLAAV